MAVFPSCPVCGALVGAFGLSPVMHIEWHRTTDTLNGMTPDEARTRMRDNAYTAEPLVSSLDETLRLPPIGDTVRRRPPVPATLRELPAGSAELFRALADAIEGDEDLNTAERQLWPPCQADPGGFVGGRGCTWPNASPCLAYGVEGCGMKAQES